MSVYIPNMEIPRERCEAIIFVHKDGSAYIAVSPGEGEVGYFREYPLVPIPPHGRLIDADAFEAEYWSAQFWGDRDAAKKVHRAPTIIPADPKDKEQTDARPI